MSPVATRPVSAFGGRELADESADDPTPQSTPRADERQDEAAPARTPPVPECAEDGCSREAAVRLHVPWADDRDVCADHARALAQRDGVVATPLDESDAEWP